MKQGSSLFLAAALLCTLLAGCSEKMPHLSATEGGVDAISPEEDTVMRCRVVAVDGENQLLLADVDGDHPDIYTLDASSVPLYRKETERGTLLADGQLSAGAMIRVAFSGGIMETYPAQFGEVTGITFLILGIYSFFWIRIKMKMPVFKSVPIQKVMAMENSMYYTIRKRRGLWR